MILDHAIHSAQSQAGAFADGLGGIEGIENSQRLANARAVIGELQHGLVARAGAR